MPEKEENEKAAYVSMDEHNKVVGAHNTVKAENEQLKKELEEIKTQKEEEAQKEEAKKEWQDEKDGLQKQMDELKKQVEEKKETKVSKGIVSDRKEEQKEQYTPDAVKKLIDEKLPDRPLNPEKFGSKIQRYGHYKSGTTKHYTDEQLAWGLSLHANAQANDPQLIPSAAKAAREDIIVRR